MTAALVPPEGVWLTTERLVLRRWLPGDLEPFAEMNADPGVMEHLPRVLDRSGSDALARYADSVFDAEPFGLAVVDDAAGFAGFVGLHRHRWFPDHVEIGWRLRRGAWGQGYATEAASAVLAQAFGPIGLDHVISITVAANERSLRVMRKIGLAAWREVRREGIDAVVFRVDREDGPAPAP